MSISQVVLRFPSRISKNVRGINLKSLLLVVLFGLLSLSLQAENLVPNPSFEEGPDNAPAHWQPATWSGIALLDTSSENIDGHRSVTIVSKDGADAGWQIGVPVEPRTLYQLSGWIKTEDLVAGDSRGALLNVHGMYGVETKPLTGTNDWTKVQVLFDSHHRRQVTINCLFGGWGEATGRAWYDNIRLEPVSNVEENNEIVIHVQQTGHPISPFIYGQLIEHVGKGVYGGLWAEMLEDRKFYFPIVDDFEGWVEKGQIYPENAFFTELASSPWEVIGPRGSVSMTQTEAFVGKQSPQITLHRAGVVCGIGQGRLAIIEGRRYSGRIYLAGDRQAGPVHVRLMWGQDRGQSQTIVVRRLRNEYEEIPLEFIAGATTDNARLEIVGLGRGTFSVGCVSLMPSDNVSGWRREVVGLLKEMNATIYKWPGGNFVSGYDWRDGIGNRDLRAPKANPAWKGIEDNDVGLHEYLELCRILNAKPTLAVNAGSGDAQMAAMLVEYVNGGSNTPMGQLRRKNGHPQPYSIKYFYIGNEMWGSHQIGSMPQYQYVVKHNEIVKAMREVDSSIKVIAVGRSGSWSQRMFRECSGYMDYISDNFYATSSEHFMEHINQPPEAVRHITNSHRRLDVNKTTPLVIDEWGYWYGAPKYGSLGVQYYFQDAFGIVAGLHEMFRHTDVIQIVHYAQAVNVLGAIKTSKTDAIFDVPGLIFRLYRNEYGEIPVYVENLALSLNVSAALSKDKNYLMISVMNPTEEKQAVNLRIEGAVLSDYITQFSLQAMDLKAYNEPGRNLIDIDEQSLSNVSKLIEIQPLCITLLKCEIQ